MRALGLEGDNFGGRERLELEVKSQFQPRSLPPHWLRVARSARKSEKVNSALRQSDRALSRSADANRGKSIKSPVADIHGNWQHRGTFLFPFEFVIFGRILNWLELILLMDQRQHYRSKKSKNQSEIKPQNMLVYWGRHIAMLDHSQTKKIR